MSAPWPSRAGATIGSVVIYYVYRTSIGSWLRAKFEADAGFMDRLAKGIDRNAFTTLFTLRVIPSVPFVLVNATAGMMAVPLRPYVDRHLHRPVAVHLHLHLDRIAAGRSVAGRGAAGPAAVAASVLLAADGGGLPVAAAAHRHQAFPDDPCTADRGDRPGMSALFDRVAARC